MGEEEGRDLEMRCGLVKIQYSLNHTDQMQNVLLSLTRVN